MSKNKVFISLGLFVLCGILAFSFLVPTTAKAVENVNTTFTSNTYLNSIYAYPYSNPSSTSTVWYYATWYIDFSVSANGLDVFFYSLDTNYTYDSFGPVEYAREQLNLRSYSDTSTNEDYFIYQTNTSGSNQRVVDYVCQYESLNTITNVLPTFVIVNYVSLDSVSWNFTAKNYANDSTQAPVLCQYTWGNTDYKVTLSFVVRTTRDFYERIQSANYTYTMYYDANNLSGGNSYDIGYSNGKLAGIEQANNTINKDSASYLAGYSAGLDGTFDFTSIIAGATDALNVKIFGTFGIMDMVTIVFAIVVFIIFLKMFAGG